MWGNWFSSTQAVLKDCQAKFCEKHNDAANSVLLQWWLKNKFWATIILFYFSVNVELKCPENHHWQQHVLRCRQQLTLCNLKFVEKRPVTYSKRTTVILYVITGVIFAFLILVISYKRKRYFDTVSTGKKIKTVVTRVLCSRRRGTSSLYFANEKGEIQYVNVSNRDCQRYKSGDTIQVYVSQKGDWYEIDPGSQLFVDPEN